MKLKDAILRLLLKKDRRSEQEKALDVQRARLHALVNSSNTWRF